LKFFRISILVFRICIYKIGDKIPLTELNHMSYNNLTFESDRKTLRQDSYRRGRLGIGKCPCTTALGVPGEKVSEHRERSGAFQPVRTIRLRRQRSLGHSLFTVFPGWWTQRLGSSESSSSAPSKGQIRTRRHKDGIPLPHPQKRTFSLL
jgi:hypothetical protein